MWQLVGCSFPTRTLSYQPSLESTKPTTSHLKMFLRLNGSNESVCLFPLHSGNDSLTSEVFLSEIHTRRIGNYHLKDSWRIHSREKGDSHISNITIWISKKFVNLHKWHLKWHFAVLLMGFDLFNWLEIMCRHLSSFRNTHMYEHVHIRQFW